MICVDLQWCLNFITPHLSKEMQKKPRFVNPIISNKFQSTLKKLRLAINAKEIDP